MSERLPLFPLQLVLFPGSALPLHIFEDRYKRLINECIASQGEFGISLVQEGGLMTVGCTAAVVAVVHTYEDGRMDIIVEGRRRYRVERVESDAAAYAVGYVRFLETSAETVDPSLTAETITLYNELVARVYRGSVPQINVQASAGDLSFRLAPKAGMDLLERQKLLETPSESDRLKLLRDHLVAVLPKLDQIEEIERVVRTDGYLPTGGSTEDV
jgi:ATP-dependent Lon protease